MLRYVYIFMLLCATSLCAWQDNPACAAYQAEGFSPVNLCHSGSAVLRQLQRDHQIRRYKLRLQLRIARVQHEQLLQRPCPPSHKLHANLNAQAASMAALRVEDQEFARRLSELWSKEAFQPTIAQHAPHEGLSWTTKRGRWRGRSQRRIRDRKEEEEACELS